MDKVSATCPECGFRVASNARRTDHMIGGFFRTVRGEGGGEETICVGCVARREREANEPDLDELPLYPTQRQRERFLRRKKEEGA